MRSIIFLLVLFLITFYSCELDNEENIYYEKLVNKNWISQNGMDYTYTFSRNSECICVSKYLIFNPLTNEIIEECDTTKSYWKLNGHAVMFSSTGNFPSETEIQPTDWIIIELKNDTLKFKYYSDFNNPYILPWVYASN